MTSKNHPGTLVALPLRHTKAIARNPEFFSQESYLHQIDEHFESVAAPSPLGDDSPKPDSSDAKAPASFILCGMGGIGKTELAIEYVLSRQDKFDAVFWVLADTTKNLASGFAEIAKRLGLSSEPGNEPDDVMAREVVRGWLANPVGRFTDNDGKVTTRKGRWLFAFDNADDPEILCDWMPSQGPGAILVTSRDPTIRESPFLTDGLDLSSLSPEEGGDMLRRLSKREDEVDAVDLCIKIATALGGVPLAISQMCAIMRRKNLSLKEFKEYYKEDAKSLLSMKVAGMSSALPKYDRTIWTTWAVDQLPPNAYALLKILVVLDPDTIQEQLLRSGANDVEPPDYPKTGKAYFDARAKLIQSSLVKRDIATHELSIHRLVQDVVRERLTSDELHDIFASAAILLAAVWPFASGTDPTRNQAWRTPICEKYSPHIIRLEVMFGPSIRSREYTGTVKSAAVFSSYSWYMAERSFMDQCELFAALARIILEAAKADGRGDEKEVTGLLSECHHNQSFAAIYTGSGGAMEHANAWLQILTDRTNKWDFDEDALAMAAAYNQIALCHIHRNDVQEAIANWVTSLFYLEVPSAPKLSGVWPAINLALIYTIEKRLKEADDVLAWVLEEREKVLGKDDKTTSESGAVWRAMGKVRIRRRRYDEGLAYLQRAAENLKATLGDNHYMTGDCFYEIALEMLRKGEMDAAVQHLDAAIKAFRDVWWQRAQAARALWKKGTVMRAVGKGAEGDALMYRAMKIRKEVASGDDRSEEKLKDADWDEHVFYYSR